MCKSDISDSLDVRGRDQGVFEEILHITDILDIENLEKLTNYFILQRTFV